MEPRSTAGGAAATVSSHARAVARPAAARRNSARAPARAPVRVLIACDHIDFDGALHGGGRQLIELARALERRHDEVEPTICILRPPTRLGHALRAEGLPFEFFGHGRFNPISLGRLIKVIRERRIDVMHLTDFGACTLGRIAGRLTRTPSIVQIISHHSEYTNRKFPRYVELAYRALAPATARALAISPTVRDFAIQRMGFPPEMVEVLYYPLPEHSFSEPSDGDVAALRQSLGIPRQAPVVGWVGRFFPVKGVRHLIDGFAALLAREPRAWLVLVGQGPEESALRAQCARLGIAHRVVFAGFQRETQRYVRMFDVSVVPSLEEGFGLVALEALALGVPVVASRLGGLPDVVSDERSGVLVEPANAQAIAQAVARLLGDPALRRRMGAVGRAECRRYSLDGYVDRLTTLYRELARRPRAGQQLA